MRVQDSTLYKSIGHGGDTQLIWYTIKLKIRNIIVEENQFCKVYMRSHVLT